MARQIKTELVVKDKGTKTVRKFSNTTVSLMKKLAGPLAIGAVTAGFAALVKSQIDYGDQLQKLNIRLGTNVNQLDKLRKIAELSGVPFNTLTMSLQRMTRRLQEVASTGGGVAATALQRLGIEAKNIASLSPDEQFRIVATQLDKVADSGEKVALAFKLFDSEGVRVLNMTKNLNVQLDKTNSNWSQEKADQAAAYNDRMTEFKQTMQDFAVNVLPVVTSGMNALTTATKFWMEAMREKTSIERYKSSLESLNQKMRDNAAEQKAIQKRLNSPSMFDKATFASVRLKERMAVLKEEFARNKQGADVLQAAIDKLTTSVNKAGAAPGVTPIESTPLGKAAADIPNKTAMKYETMNTQYVFDQSQERIKIWEEEQERRKQAVITARENEFQISEQSDQRNRARQTKAITDLVKAENDAAKEREGIIKRTQTFFATGITDTFGEIITGAKSAKQAFSDMARNMIADMAKMAAQKAIMGLFSNMGGGYAGLLGSIVGMASGGNTQKNRPYIVGENGPELFMSNQDGTIIPNHAMGGSNVAVSVNVDASNSNVSDPAEANRLGTTIGKIVEQNVKQVLMKERRYGGILSTQKRRFA